VLSVDQQIMHSWDVNSNYYVNHSTSSLAEMRGMMGKQLFLAESKELSTINPATRRRHSMATSKDECTNGAEGRKLDTLKMKSMRNGRLVIKQVGLVRIWNN